MKSAGSSFREESTMPGRVYMKRLLEPLATKVGGSSVHPDPQGGSHVS